MPPENMIRPLKLPSRPARVRAESKALWNEARSVSCADFFTVGYEGRSTDDLIASLHSAGIRLLLYRPELSKRNFAELLARSGIQYLHIAQWGVPREISGASYRGRFARADMAMVR